MIYKKQMTPKAFISSMTMVCGFVDQHMAIGLVASKVSPSIRAKGSRIKYTQTNVCFLRRILVLWSPKSFVFPCLPDFAPWKFFACLLVRLLTDIFTGYLSSVIKVSFINCPPRKVAPGLPPNLAFPATWGGGIKVWAKGPGPDNSDLSNSYYPQDINFFKFSWCVMTDRWLMLGGVWVMGSD